METKTNISKIKLHTHTHNGFKNIGISTKGQVCIYNIS